MNFAQVPYQIELEFASQQLQLLMSHQGVGVCYAGGQRSEVLDAGYGRDMKRIQRSIGKNIHPI